MVVKDGIVITYVKDGVIYPVALSTSEYRMIESLVAGICNPLKVVFDQPQGTAVALKVGGKKDGD